MNGNPLTVCNLAVSVMKSGNGLRNVALAAEEYRAGCPVFQTLPQLFKPNFSHPNNPQLFSALSLLSYFKLSLKQSVFPPRNLHHIGLQQCVMLSHIIAGCLRLKWLRYSFFCHIIYIFVFLQNVGCRKEVHTDGDAYQQPHTHTHM